MTAKELRQKYLDFFKGKGHAVIPSASLIPENDPSVLFTTAGMHPLVPFLMGEKHPLGNRLANVQKCVRTGDIDEVGDAFHHTFFEMLGNWSLGSYFKKEAIEWSWEFLTSPEWLGLDKEKISVSCFAGDSDAPRDEESAEIWKSVGVPENKIRFLPKSDNWWGPAGATGPCGPDTEMFFGAIEIWNDVFIQYNKTAEGKYEMLAQKNVDTGMGLERTLAVASGLDDNYRTELFWPIIEQIEKLSGKKYEGNEKPMRIIADHIKASTFILGDEKGIQPSNTGQGYVLRRLIRRAVRYIRSLTNNTEQFNLTEIAKVVVEMYKDVYPELEKNRIFILENLKQEEEKFEKTLEKGLKEFEKGASPFVLFSTYGFPIEMTKELAKEKGVEIDEKKFQEELNQHQELSRTASAGMFKGGLADAGEETKKLHTAAHLMLAGLRQVLGNHVSQKGSNITAERLRFDFSHPQKMTSEEIKKVEEIVNEKIAEKLPVKCEEMDTEEAKKAGATGAFEHKYGDRVKVYSVGSFSCEICGGPHVENTGELGHFKIIKEEASSAGVRRIKAILENAD